RSMSSVRKPGLSASDAMRRRPLSGGGVANEIRALSRTSDRRILKANRNRPHREATTQAPPDVLIAHCNGGTAMTVAPTLQKYLDQTVTYELISHDATMSST